MIVKSPADKLLSKNKIKGEHTWWMRIYPELAATVLTLETTVVLITPRLGKFSLKEAILLAKSPEEKLRIYLTAAEELAKLHKNHIAHGDVHEENIRITPIDKISYAARFIDFERTQFIFDVQDRVDVWRFAVMMGFTRNDIAYSKHPDIVRIINVAIVQRAQTTIPLSLVIAALTFGEVTELPVLINAAMLT